MKNEKLIVGMTLVMLGAYLWLVRSLERQSRFAQEDIVNDYLRRMDELHTHWSAHPTVGPVIYDEVPDTVEDEKPKKDSPFLIQGLSDE